jgi:hypothetical protein
MRISGEVVWIGEASSPDFRKFGDEDARRVEDAVRMTGRVRTRAAPPRSNVQKEKKNGQA